MDSERIIEALQECWMSMTRKEKTLDTCYVRHDDLTALTALAMSGVCPECGGMERGVAQTCSGCSGEYARRCRDTCPTCTNHFHDHREALEAMLDE